jgi:hypothetical protein
LWAAALFFILKEAMLFIGNGNEDVRIYGSGICDGCNNIEFRTISDPRKKLQMTEKDKANRLKNIFQTFLKKKE